MASDKISYKVEAVQDAVEGSRQRAAIYTPNEVLK